MTTLTERSGTRFDGTLIGDAWGRSAAYDTYADGLHTYALSILRDHEAAADVVYSTFVVADRNIVALRDPDLLQPWLYALCRYECVRRRREGNDPPSNRVSRLRAVPGGPDGSGGAEAFAALERSLRRAELHSLDWPETDGVDARHREVLELTIRHSLDSRGIALVLGTAQERAFDLLSDAWRELERSLAVAALAHGPREHCTRFATLAEGWVGRLTERMREALAGHVDSCPACQHHLHTSVGTPAAPSVLPFVAAPRGLRECLLRDLAAVRSPEAANVRFRELLRRAPALDAYGFPVAAPTRPPTKPPQSPPVREVPDARSPQVPAARQTQADPAAPPRSPRRAEPAPPPNLVVTPTGRFARVGPDPAGPDSSGPAPADAPPPRRAARRHRRRSRAVASGVAAFGALGVAGSLFYLVTRGPQQAAAGAIVDVPSSASTIPDGGANQLNHALAATVTTTSAPGRPAAPSSAGSPSAAAPVAPVPAGVAVSPAGGGSGSAGVAAGALRVSVDQRSSFAGAVTIRLWNSGGAPVAWTARRDAGYLRLDHASGTLAPGAQQAVVVTVDEAAAPAGWRAHVYFEPGGSVVTLYDTNPPRSTTSAPVSPTSAPPSTSTTSAPPTATTTPPSTTPVTPPPSPTTGTPRPTSASVSP